MSDIAEIKIEEIIRAFKLMEKINSFFHQPMNYDETEKFAKNNYEEISSIYYDVMWNWLPEEIQEKLMEE